MPSVAIAQKGWARLVQVLPYATHREFQQIRAHGLGGGDGNGALNGPLAAAGRDEHVDERRSQEGNQGEGEGGADAYPG